MIDKLITLKREGETNMKKILQLTKAITLTLAAVIMLLNTNVLTAQAGKMMFPGMTKTEDGRIQVNVGSTLTTDSTGRKWYTTGNGYPYCTYKDGIEVTFRGETEIVMVNFLDYYLTDYIETHDKSEWPSFVVIGSDGIPFYYDNSQYAAYYSKFCYDKESGWWLEDRAYKGLNSYAYTVEEAAQETKKAIENGEIINGAPDDPRPAGAYIDSDESISDEVVDSDDAPIHRNDGTIAYPDGRVEYIDYSNGSKGSGHIVYPDGHVEYYDRTGDDKKIIRIEYPDGCVKYIDDQHYDHQDSHIVYPDGRVEYYCGDKIIRIEYPDGTIEIKDPYADVNTLGATVTLKTDCIKVKTNKKGVVAQKPLPKSVKVGKKALKKNKTFTVSYEKYTDDWKTVDAVTDEGIYRLVITGQNGYDGVCTKRLYVTADKTIKAMSSVSVKVNKMSYTGNPITSDVIKTAKIGKRTLTDGTDYTVTYTNNTDIGTAQVTLTAKDGSGLLGTKTVNFTITGNKITKAKVNGLKALTYSPNTDMVQNLRYVYLTYNGKTLAKDVDYTVSYVNNTKAGTAKIVFTGKGLYNGTLTKSFKITKAQLSDSMLDDASKKIEVTYTGKAVKPEVTLKDGETTLKKGTDYTLTYKNNVKVSTAEKPAQITVKGKGNYTGSFKVDFAVIAKSNGSDEKSNAKNIKSNKEDDKLAEDEAVVDEPATEEPVSDEPTEEEPVSEEPTEDEPATDEPTEEEPIVEEPTEEDPAKDEPTGDEPVIDESGTENTADTDNEDTDNKGEDDTGVTDEADITDSASTDDIDEDDTDITDEETESEIISDTASDDITVEAEIEKTEDIEHSVF